MPNLYDVAKMAGVSKTLVSRVINNQKGVSDKSRQKILQAMKQLNYTPNAIARSLVLQQTSIIGVVLDSLCEPYFFNLIKGIEFAISSTQYEVIFCSAKNEMQLKNKYIKFLSEGRADGVIIYGSNLGDVELIKRLSESTFPFVVVENEIEGMIVNNVVVDNILGSKLAVDHLFQIGCSKIYHVTGDMKIKAAADRKEGYIKAMRQHGCVVDEDMILKADFTVESGYNAIKTFLDNKGVESLPDAFYFGADTTAFGGMMALEDYGVKIPENIKIVGFDNDKPYNIERKLKKLTTLEQPLYRIGQAAVNILIEQINNPDMQKQKIVFYPELIIGETTISRA